MLDAFIIDELRRREQEEKGESIRPRLELPLDDRHPPAPGNGNGGRGHRDEDDEKSERGVVIIDL